MKYQKYMRLFMSFPWSNVPDSPYTFIAYLRCLIILLFVFFEFNLLPEWVKCVLKLNIFLLMHRFLFKHELIIYISFETCTGIRILWIWNCKKHIIYMKKKYFTFNYIILTNGLKMCTPLYPYNKTFVWVDLSILLHKTLEKQIYTKVEYYFFYFQILLHDIIDSITFKNKLPPLKCKWNIPEIQNMKFIYNDTKIKWNCL